MICNKCILMMMICKSYVILCKPYLWYSYACKASSRFQARHNMRIVSLLRSMSPRICSFSIIYLYTYSLNLWTIYTSIELPLNSTTCVNGYLAQITPEKKSMWNGHIIGFSVRCSNVILRCLSCFAFRAGVLLRGKLKSFEKYKIPMQIN